MAPASNDRGRDLLVGAIVLAAGEAKRMGTQKLLLPLGGKCLVQWVTDAALGAKVTETIVVLGNKAEAVRAALIDRPVRVVENPAYALGMSTSLQAGIRELSSGAHAAVFLLGDQPFVTSALVDRLVEGFAETGAWIVRPETAGGQGHPVLMSAALFPELLEQRGDVGGREIVRRYPERLVTVPWEDSRPALDIDTREDYRTASRYLTAETGRREDSRIGDGN